MSVSARDGRTGQPHGGLSVSHIAWFAAAFGFALVAGSIALVSTARGQQPGFYLEMFAARTRSVIVATIIKRDGDFCFYCGEPFGDARPRTKEHLVGRTHGGPDHISNLFLSCEMCNTEAGHLSAPEKIRLRDRKRRGRGSQLLARAFDRFFGGEGDLTLLDDIKTFLHLQEGTD